MPKKKPDFREAAASESVELVGPELFGPPLELGLSLCHPCPNPPKMWWPMAITISSLVIGVAGLAVGAILVSIPDDTASGSSTDNSWWLIAGATCSILGTATLLAGNFIGRFWVRRQLRDRLPITLDADPTLKFKRVDLEDAATFEKLKPSSEDLGVIILDPKQQAVLIEGLQYRYTIFQDDLHELTQVKGGRSLGVKITYQVGSQMLSIVLGQQDSLLHQLRKQTIGAHTAPLLKKLQDTFGFVKAR